MKDKQGRGCAKTWVLKTGQNSQFWLQDTSVVCSYRKMEAYMNVKTKDCFFFYDSLAGLFSGLSCYCKTVARRQSLIEFQNSIIYHFQFN